jgi:hypothetical protein
MRHSLSDESTRAATVLSGKIVLESDSDLDLTIDDWTLVCDVMLLLGNRAVFVHKLCISTHGYLWVSVGSGSVLSYSWVVGSWLVDQSHLWEQTHKNPSWDIKILKTCEFRSG